ncbi:MAG: saccharopine dehydrogenase NADP-binding domain-containing protein, partial [Kiloniellales bacterium]
MSQHKTYVGFDKRLVMLGCGSIGQGVLPLLLRHLGLEPEQITVIAADDFGVPVAREYGIEHITRPLTRENCHAELQPRLGAGDFLLNLSVDVSSVALIELAREAGALYLDTCIEPWVGGYTDTSLSPSLRSNYALRESALKLKSGNGPTAVLTHGANPGLVSHFVKQALLDIARDCRHKTAMPSSREDWAKLMQALGVKVIHVAERDTQVSNKPKKVGEFVNTWSIDGFVSEGCQPAEMGWGTHEKLLPYDGAHHDFGCGAAIYLNRPG